MLVRLVLAVEPEALQQALAEELGRDRNVHVESMPPGEDLWRRLGATSADAVVMADTRLPAPAEEMLRVLSELPDAPALILLTETGDADARASYVAAGADAVLQPSVRLRRLRDGIRAVLARRAAAPRGQTDAGGALAEPRLSDFVSRSTAMQAFMDVVGRVVGSDVSLLILGETGVGKERLARAIHAEGPRAGGPFVAVNCGALPETLLESELFGHVQGSFTGATRGRRGAFEMAHRGAIFLDEIGEMPLHLQVKLLRVLQEKEIRRVGAEASVGVDVRILAATNRDVLAEAEAGGFRRDLYYRLSVVTLTIPPLRERREDIPELVESYLEFLRPRVGRTVRSIAPAAVRALQQYPWPGNVRELINVIERAMLLARTDRITPADLPALISGSSPSPPLHGGAASGPGARPGPPPEWLELPLPVARERLLEQFERDYLASVLRRCRGRVGEAARLAGLQPRTLYEKMRRLGLRKEDFRFPPVRDDA